MNRPTFYIAVTFALFVTAYSGELRTVDGASGKTLFTLIEPATARSGESRSSLASVREALIAIDPTAMRGVGSSTIRLPLLDGKTYLAKQLTSEGLETRSLDDITWRGKIIDGEFAGDVVITSRKGLIAGLIYSPDWVCEIILKGGVRLHPLRELPMAQTVAPVRAGACSSFSSRQTSNSVTR